MVKKLIGVLPESNGVIPNKLNSNLSSFYKIDLQETQSTTVIEYFLALGQDKIPLNPLLGKTITLTFVGNIHCTACQQQIKKSYQQGYCFHCTQKLAACDICIVRPEKCHFSLGSCREPDWAKTHCFTPHIVYLANTSGLKVGITRRSQIPSRWIDQGAIEALAIAEVSDRHQAGLIEVALAKVMSDKTDWRKMLKGAPPSIDLEAKRDELSHNWPDFLTLLAASDKMARLPNQQEALKIQPRCCSVQNLHYPILSYPEKVTSLNLEKTAKITGTLLGIKGQYLILDIGVFNVRAHTGFELGFEAS